MLSCNKRVHSAMMGQRLLFYFVLGLVTVSVSTMDAEMAELAQMLRENCIEETGADIGLINQVNGGADLMPDPKLMCYMKCVMELAGMLSDGEVDVEAVIGILPEDLRNRNAASIRQCGTIKGADDCETSFLTQACWQKANKPDYMLV